MALRPEALIRNVKETRRLLKKVREALREHDCPSALRSLVAAASTAGQAGQTAREAWRFKGQGSMKTTFTVRQAAKKFVDRCVRKKY